MSRISVFNEVKELTAADATIQKYDAISKVIFQQRAEMARAASKEQISYILYLTKGYLHGLMLSRTISKSDVDTYMSDLTKFAIACGETI